MKKITYFKHIFSVILCVLMILSILSTSLFAAKEQFREIKSAGVTGIDAPVAGKTGDYSANVVNTGVYTVEKIEYYEAASNKLHPSTATFKYDTQYYVLVTLKTKSAYYFSYNGSTGKPNITATCNGATAEAVDLGPNADSTMFGIKYTFPKTEAQNPNIIYSVNLTGLDLPSHYSKPDTSVSSDDYRVSTEVVWKNQDGTAFNGVFEYGKSYTAMIYLFINNNYDFAKDYDNPLATADKPMPAVTVTLDGEKISSVLPDYTRNQFMRCLVVSKVYKCEGKMVLSSISLSDVKVPTAGDSANYNFTCDQNGYLRNDSMHDSVYHKGVAWRVDGGKYLETGNAKFDANETYQIVIRMKPMNGFEFDVDDNGNSRMTATVNGNTAEIKSSKTEAIITYTFPKTGNSVIDNVDIGGVDIPEAGKAPDYTVSYGDNYGYADYNDRFTKNGVSWYNETDRKSMSATDKFEEGKTYSVQIMIWSNEGYEFQYKSGAVNVAATVNGHDAEVSSRDKEEVTLYFTFPKIAEHKHSPVKVDEVKATCTESGKKSYYFCSECGRNFEDSKCTKEISDINVWGKIEKKSHSGGKATCESLAICKDCGEYYGELAAHQFSSAWDYKDENGHAHKCRVCGINDAIVSHSGGTAKCGEMAKCEVCKAQYGEEKQHQWSKTPEYTDSKGHAYKCTVCGKHDTIQEHIGGDADCKNKAKCTVCGTEYGKNGDHMWGTEWTYTNTKGHAHTCTVCGAHDDVVNHTPGAEATETEPQICISCDYVLEPAIKHEHKLTKVDAVKEGCTTDGMRMYYSCEGCSKIFSDSKGKNEITDKDSLIIPATGHKESKWKSDADVHWKECTVKDCDAITVEKEAHEFNKTGKCTVCGYKSGEKTDPDEPTDTPQIPNEPNEEEPDVPNDPSSEPADVNTPDIDGGDNTAMLIAVIAAGAVAVICIILVIVVLATKNKKK